MIVFAIIGIIVVIMFIASHILSIGFELFDIFKRIALLIGIVVILVLIIGC